MIGAISASQGWYRHLVMARGRNRCSVLNSAAMRIASVRNLYGGLHWQRAAADADLAHRIGHTDALVLEDIPKRQHHVAFHVVHSVRIGDPEGQGKLHAGLGEFDEDAV